MQYSATSIIRPSLIQNLDYPASEMIEIVGGAGRFYARELLICQLSTS